MPGLRNTWHQYLATLAMGYNAGYVGCINNSSYNVVFGMFAALLLEGDIESFGHKLSRDILREVETEVCCKL